MTMRTLIRATVLALAIQQGASLTAALAAQGGGGAAPPSNPACALVTEKDVEEATGLDYGPGEHFDELNVGRGKWTCAWAVENLPGFRVDFFPASAGGSNTDARAKVTVPAQCTRASVRGVGERAFVETCEGSISTASVYARTGRSDIAVVVYLKRGESMASPVKSVAIALAKAAAARAKGK